jgi:hypothetical protein
MIIDLLQQQKTESIPNEILSRIAEYITVDLNTANVIILSAWRVLREHDIECNVEAPK